jgi:hypothetical protein
MTRLAIASAEATYCKVIIIVVLFIIISTSTRLYQLLLQPQNSLLQLHHLLPLTHHTHHPRPTQPQRHSPATYGCSAP